MEDPTIQVGTGGGGMAARRAEPYYTYDFLDRHIALCTLGCSSSAALLSSFSLEHDLREAWWHPKRDDWVVDVGAGHGSYSLPALALGARVVAFEPDKDCLYDLLGNAALNGWAGRLQALPVLAGDGSCNAARDYHPASHSRLRREGVAEARRVVALDALWCPPPGAGITCSWLKVDVEGDEAAVLKGAQRLLREESPTVLVECHVGYVPGVDQEVCTLMTAAGYKEEGRRRGEGINDLWLLFRKG